MTQDFNFTSRSPNNQGFTGKNTDGPDGWSGFMNNLNLGGRDPGSSGDGNNRTYSWTITFNTYGRQRFYANVDDQGSIFINGSAQATMGGLTGQTLVTTSSYYAPGTYTLSATIINSGGGPWGVALDWVDAVPPPPPIANLNINKTSIISGQNAIISWSASGIALSSVSLTGFGNIGVSGSSTISPTSTTTYTFTATGIGGVTTKSVTIIVYQPVVVTIDSDPTSIALGENTLLSWTTSGDANTASINQDLGPVLLSSSRVISPLTTRTYTITASGPGGTDSDSVSITVFQPPTANISINKTSIISGQNARITWSATGLIDSVSITNIGSVANSGSQNVSPTSSKTYRLTVSGPGGVTTDTVNLTVYQPVVADITTIPSSIITGQTAQLSWTTSGDANTASINQGIGAVLLSSNRTVNPTTTRTYTLTASGLGGTDSDSTTLTVFQRPTLQYSSPSDIDYGDSLSIPFTYRYATSGLNIIATYVQRNPNTGNPTTVTQNINLQGTNSDESGPAITRTANFAIPWTIHGTFDISFTATSSGSGGANSQSSNITVNVDKLPDSINVPDSLGAPLEQVASPDEILVVSDPILITDIEVATEITSNFPIQVRFDDTDPEIETNWKDVRRI